MKARIPKNTGEPEFYAMSLGKEEGGGRVNYPKALFVDEKTNESMLYTYAGFSQVADKDGVFYADFTTTSKRIGLTERRLKNGLQKLLERGYIVPMQQADTYQFTPYKAATIRK